VFEYALDIGRLEVNPVQRVARRLPKRVKGENETQAHVETIEAARNVLAVIEAARVQPASLLAHRFIALTAVRKMEAVEAEWTEIDFAAQTWTIPARRMKGRRGQKREHVVTLSPQALDVLHAARQLAPAESTLVFPTARGKALAASKLNDLMVGALRRAKLGGSHTVHGWRATFSTILNEADPTNYRVIDVSLAHKAFSGVEAHYNHARYLAERRRVACAWADMLMVGAPSAWALVGLEEPSNVVPFKVAA
jgi:integrase